MLTDITTWIKASKVHGEVRESVRPASTYTEVSRVIDPRWMVEIEAGAIVDYPCRRHALVRKIPRDFQQSVLNMLEPRLFDY